MTNYTIEPRILNFSEVDLALHSAVSDNLESMAYTDKVPKCLQSNKQEIQNTLIANPLFVTQGRSRNKKETYGAFRGLGSLGLLSSLPDNVDKDFLLLAFVFQGIDDDTIAEMARAAAVEARILPQLTWSTLFKGKTPVASNDNWKIIKEVSDGNL